ncbi:hypothetical protein [Neoroseomonas lacus]|uniref:Uncharacterized protein n=1 Tax=Neoroseomonas lacus TaxID=287609 RepID=A0A917NSH2_9PROT|nr:hypothetical protein [Neoroseomonas lacus]GGJ20699.1 hypothetical protein GCM10011320_30000 [Neoroseomonas lacus]
MVLRLIGLLMGAAALVMGLSFGWGLPLGTVLSQINPRAMLTLQEGVSVMLWSGAWDSLFYPVLTLPAWVAPLAVALVLFLISATRPERG